jgi:hypothetical protein
MIACQAPPIPSRRTPDLLEPSVIGAFRTRKLKVSETAVGWVLKKTNGNSQIFFQAWVRSRKLRPMARALDASTNRSPGSHSQRTKNHSHHNILFIRELENHVFLDPEIERSILARDVFYRRCTTASLFRLCITKKIFVGAHGQES